MRRLAPGVALLAALVLAGCSDDADPASPTEPASAAPAYAEGADLSEYEELDADDTRRILALGTDEEVVDIVTSLAPESVTVDTRLVEGDQRSRTLVEIDDSGACSGHVDTAGGRVDFVSRYAGSTVVTSEQPFQGRDLDGRWLVVERAQVPCDSPQGNIFGTGRTQAPGSLVPDPEVASRELVDGRPRVVLRSRGPEGSGSGEIVVAEVDGVVRVLTVAVELADFRLTREVRAWGATEVDAMPPGSRWLRDAPPPPSG
ncbi:hypothetical protein [Nocardioides sp. SYSU D00038]|uniref:hypothetical protein n=1 Tax=Nocardioides sp. SYSU D00038 TaxID=2812554 RepID=UPI0019672469|nr:hypothetical protein [Nocardioides sp. SYSU D00038]